MLSTRQQLRLAARLLLAWREKPPPDPGDRDWDLLASRLQRLDVAHLRWKRAFTHPLRLILPDLQREVRSALEDLTRHVERLRSPLDEVPSRNRNPDPTFSPPSLRHWLAELRQLDEEFDDFIVDWKAKTLTVTTDSITLKDVPLGRFSIVFAWSRVGTMAGSRCFDLVALDPNPARGKDDVTHPHVRDQELCAGDAGQPLDHAIREGRLADAFLLIRSVLTSYNSKSPYVSLDDWDGTSCGECGSSTDPNESSSCGACHSNLCDSCVCSCSGCSDSRCLGCLQRCDACHEACCPGCLETIDDQSLCSECIGTCAECQTRIRKEELSPDQRCSSCLTPETDDDDTVPSPSPSIPHQPDSPLESSYSRSALSLEAISPLDVA